MAISCQIDFLASCCTQSMRLSSHPQNTNEDTRTQSAKKMKANECSFQKYKIFANIR